MFGKTAEQFLAAIEDSAMRVVWIRCDSDFAGPAVRL